MEVGRWQSLDCERGAVFSRRLSGPCVRCGLCSLGRSGFCSHLLTLTKHVR